MDKKVSIITPCFNGEEFVGRYLDSILRQTYKNIELIFINDGSIDNTEYIVKNYIEKFNKEGMKLIYIYQENSGQAVALNKGLELFSGDYLTWPDSDDILSDDSIEKKVKFLEENKQYGLVRSDAKRVKEYNLDDIIGYFGNNKTNKYSEEIFEELIIEKMYVCCGCYMVRVTSFLDVNPSKKIYEGNGGQNWQMLLPITYKYRCGYIDEALYTYVIRENSHSHSVKDINDQIKRCYEHEEILINVINSINMSNKDKVRYLKIIKEKYIRKRFDLSCDYRDKKLLEKFYKEMKNNIRIGKSEYMQYLISKYLICNIAIRRISKIKRRLVG